MSEKQCLFGKESAYRIPSLVNAGGTLVAVCDKEPNSNDYGYIELAVRTSSDGGKTWGDIKVIASPPARQISSDWNSSKTAFFIDPCMTVAPNGDIVMLVTFFPESKGIMERKLLEKKTAVSGFDGGLYPILYDRDGNYYIVLGDGRVLDSSKARTPYTVKDIGELYKDEEYVGNIYLNGAMGRANENEKTTFGAPLKAPKRSFIFMLKSSDKGETWSVPKDITPNILCESDGPFLGVAPGSALTTNSGRMIVPLYTFKGTVCIYSDDNGETWNRNNRIPYTQNTGEWTAVEAPGGDIYSFGRASAYGKTPVSISSDKGISWVKSKKAAFKAPKCQKSAVTAGNKVFVSHPSGRKRENGIISIGEFLLDKNGKAKGIKWSRDTIEINNGFFAYSCLAKIDENTLAVLYEDQPDAHIVFETIKIK